MRVISSTLNRANLSISRHGRGAIGIALNGGLGASSPIRRVVSHRLQSAETSRSRKVERMPRFDPKLPLRQ
jgi:hypothetical protein